MGQGPGTDSPESVCTRWFMKCCFTQTCLMLLSPTAFLLPRFSFSCLLFHNVTHGISYLSSSCQYQHIPRTKCSAGTTESNLDSPPKSSSVELGSLLLLEQQQQQPNQHKDCIFSALKLIICGLNLALREEISPDDWALLAALEVRLLSPMLGFFSTVSLGQTCCGGLH